MRYASNIKDKLTRMYPEPINGIILGILLIVFRNKVCMFLQRVYEKFPKYEDGVKMLNIKFTIRPIFITILGSLILIISIFALIQVVGN